MSTLRFLCTRVNFLKFDPSTPSMRKVDDGEKRKKRIITKIVTTLTAKVDQGTFFGLKKLPKKWVPFPK